MSDIVALSILKRIAFLQALSGAVVAAQWVDQWLWRRFRGILEPKTASSQTTECWPLIDKTAFLQIGLILCYLS